MELKLRETADIHIIEIVGYIDLYNAHKLGDLVEKSVRIARKKIIIDLGKVEHIDSSGIGVLIQAFSLAKKSGLPIAFTNIHGSVGSVIETTKLTGYFPITETLDDAVRQLGA